MTDVICHLCRQCASAALNDVRQYLTEEGGQVAVGYMFVAASGVRCRLFTVMPTETLMHFPISCCVFTGF